MVRCPGQDQRFWKPDDLFEVKCPSCDRVAEFFKDEARLKCRNCGKMVANPKIDLGCAEWCQYAEQCVGTSPTQKVNFLLDGLIEEMKKVYGTDVRRIEHALKVLDYARQIYEVEGGDPLIVKAAAILHDIGIKEAERKHGSSALKYQEMEGPPIARDISTKCGISGPDIEHICKIVGSHHSAKNIDTIEFAIVWDADWLVNIPTELANCSEDDLAEKIDTVFKTPTGHRIAGELFLENCSKTVNK